MILDRVQRENGVPLHQQLSRLLQQEIGAGTWAAGSLIPSEHDLCAHYGVSRTVVRQALGDLAALGLLYRVKGKGTYVAHRKLEEKFVQRSDGFYREMTGRGLRVMTTTLEQALVMPPAHVRRQLGLGERAQVVKIDRLRGVEGDLLLFVQTYIPARLCPGLEDSDLSGCSLYALLRERYGLDIASGRRTVEAVQARAPISSLLDVAKGSPLLKIESVSYLPGGQPVEYYEAWHRGDRSKFEIEMIGTGGAVVHPAVWEAPGDAAP